MFNNNSRVQFNNGIKFYENDVLFDNYVYKGNTNIEVKLDYVNPGFGIALINSEGNYLSEKKEILMFKLENKNIEIIYKNKDNIDTLEKNVKGNLNANEVICYKENLIFKISKSKNKYTLYINDRKIGIYNSPYDLESFNIGYYSSKDNIIKNINIASLVPYGWVVNMKNTNGGYIEFEKNGFNLINCNNAAEIEQLNIELKSGTYYLKYISSFESDINSYIMLSDDKRINDKEKNILNFQNCFTLKENSKVSLKFVGKYGSIHNICITKFRNNEYIPTEPLNGDFAEIDESYIKFNLNEIKKISFEGTVNFAPENIHYNPSEYAIIKTNNYQYGLNDLKISQGIKYKYIYNNNNIKISTLENVLLSSIDIEEKNFTIFKNVNGIINNLVITDINENEKNINVQLTYKKSVPGLIKSPIVVLDSYDNPLNLSSSFRISNKNNKPYYIFTNTEREYFYPKNYIKLNSLPLNTNGNVIIYGIPKDSKFDLDKIYYIEDTKDNIDLCCNFYDVLFDGYEYGINVNYKTGEIYISNIDNYKYIVIDYIKNNSYCINYKYELNSYEVDISVKDNEKINILYDNTEKKYNDYEYINEKLYYSTDIIPEKNCYIVLGR